MGQKTFFGFGLHVDALLFLPYKKRWWTTIMSSKELQTAYGAYMEAVPPSLRNTAACVLYNCVQGVCGISSKGTKVDANAEEGDSRYRPTNEVIVKSEVVTLPLDGVNATFSSLVSSSRNASRPADVSDVVLLNAGDELSYSKALCDLLAISEKIVLTPAVTATVIELGEFSYRAQIRRQVPRIMDDAGFPLVGDTALGRGINESELLTFSSQPAKDLFLMNQLQEADKLLKAVVSPLPDFTKNSKKGKDGEEADAGSDSMVLGRKFFRHMPAIEFSQVLSREAAKEPMTLKKYYELTDELVYVLNWPPPDRRLGRSDWAPSDNLRSKSALSQIGGVSGTARYQQDTVTLTPAGQSIVMVKQLYSTSAAWVSVYLDGVTFGLRGANDLENFANKLSPKRLSAPSAVVEEVVEVMKVESKTEVEVDVEGGEGEEGEEGEGEGDEEASEGDPDEEPEERAARKEAEAAAKAKKEAEEEAARLAEIRAAAEAAEAAKGICPPTYFVCEGDDSSRIIAFLGPASTTKPDKQGTYGI